MHAELSGPRYEEKSFYLSFPKITFADELPASYE